MRFIGFAVGCVGEFGVYTWAKRRWRFRGTHDFRARQQLLMRLAAIAACLVAIPAVAGVAAAGMAGTDTGYVTGTALFLFGFAPLIAMGRANSFEIEQRQVESSGSLSMSPARAAWIDLGTIEHLRVAWLARWGTPHPDPYVAAAARAYADYVVETKRFWHRALARRIQRIPSGSSTTP